jgi:ornithine carbamoyltransferase
MSSAANTLPVRQPPEGPAQPAPPAGQHKSHGLGLTSATGLVIGSIIGTGVFTMPGVLAAAGTSSLIVLAGQARHRGHHCGRRRARPGPWRPTLHDLPRRTRCGVTPPGPGKDGQVDLHGRNLLKEIDLTAEEFLYLVDLAGTLRTEKRLGKREHQLAGRNIALIFEKASTRTRSAFEVGAHDEGGHVTYLGPDESHMGSSESIKDTARVLGRMYDGIEFRGFTQESIEILGKFAGVPVWNGLTDTWHPTQMLADILTMHDHAGKPLDAVTYCYLGDGRNNTANSLLVTGAMLGMDARICAPAHLQPSAQIRQIAKAQAAESGARLTISADVTTAVADADFLYTDVWLSMGEPASEWDERIDQLLPYQVNAEVMAATGNPSVKFMHCLPALHNRETEVGRQIYERRGLTALEVTDEVFESPASIVFDEAENRMHTIKALMVATLGPRP